MAGFTLFPAEAGVNLPVHRLAALVAPLRSRVSHMAICAAVALACNEGLQPTTAAPAIRGTVTYQGHLPDSLRDSTGAVLVVAFATFPQTPADLLHFAAVAFLDTGGPPRRYELRVPTGTYEWVLAVWEKKSNTELGPGNADSLLREVGFYRDAGDTTTLAAGDSLERDYRLPASPVELQPTIVTAAKRSQLLDESATSVAVMNDTDLARRAVATVDEAVNRAPGVLFLNGQVNIRGSSGFVEGLGSRVLLLVDGVPANQGDRGGIDWDMVPLVDVERVEVVKGAGASLYGSAAFGGVVNLITHDVPVGWHGRLRATGGACANPPSEAWTFRDHTGGLGGLDVTGSYGTETLRGSLTLGGRHSDGYREQDRSDQWETAGRAEWLPRPGTRITASGAWTSHQYEVFPTWCVPGACIDARGQAFQPFMIDTSGRGSYTRSNKGYLAATVDRTVSGAFAWRARGSWLRSHFTDYNPDDWSVSDRLGAELTGVLHAAGGDDRVVTVGMEGAHTAITSDIFGDSGRVGSHTQVDIGPYAEAEQRVGRVRLTAA